MFVKKEGFLLMLEKGFNPFFPPFYFTQDKKLFWGRLFVRKVLAKMPLRSLMSKNSLKKLINKGAASQF